MTFELVSSNIWRQKHGFFESFDDLFRVLLESRSQDLEAIEIKISNEQYLHFLTVRPFLQSKPNQSKSVELTKLFGVSTFVDCDIFGTEISYKKIEHIPIFDNQNYLSA